MKFSKIIAFVGIIGCLAFSLQTASAETKEAAAKPQINKQTVESGKNSMTSSRVANMTRMLGLTPEQQTAIKAVLDEEAAKLKELRADENQTIAQLKAKTKELRTATSARIRSILTPEQQQKEDDLRKRAAERRKSEPANLKTQNQQAR